MATKKKKKFEYMSTNEWLGDMTTHFMKSGDTLRAPENEDQETLSQYIPRTANGVKVEYDIAYDVPGKIHGYKFSDFLTKAIYIAPQSFDIARNNISMTCNRGSTAVGQHVVEQLRQNITDKYILHNEESFDCKNLIILPGTNLLSKEDIVDMEKIDRLVAEGAYVKLHPITEKTWVAFLKNRWKGKVIDADVPLYPLLKRAEKVWFTLSSETGISSVLFGKKIGLVNHPQKKQRSNFEHIYAGMDLARPATMIKKIESLFSHPESGMLTIYHEDPGARVDAFFTHMSKYPHK